MEWNTKWEWENFDIFNSKGIITSPKKLQSDYWGIKDGEDIDESFNMSGVVVNGSRGSASDVGNNSSVSAASTESSLKEGLNGFGCFPANGTSPLEASVCSNEPFIGLKLGKRTYFENNSNNKTSSSSSSSLVGIPVCLGKKVKSSCHKTPNSRCQVEGCNLDLSSAKEYHRKHRVCETHSKSPKVIVANVERRFCQQCSRFHGMSDFDGEKRSCRKRLSVHNARRRKQQQEPIRFNSSFYDTHMIQSTNNPSKYCMAQVKAEKFVDNDVMPVPVPVPPRGCRGVIFDEGFKESLDSVDLHRALSLLSNNSCDQNSISFQNPMHSSCSMPQHDAVPQAEYWQIFKSPSYENSFLFHPNG